MICEHSDCPTITPEQIEALHARYLAERDRRIVKNHNDQYIATSGEWLGKNGAAPNRSARAI